MKTKWNLIEAHEPTEEELQKLEWMQQLAYETPEELQEQIDRLNDHLARIRKDLRVLQLTASAMENQLEKRIDPVDQASLYNERIELLRKAWDDMEAQAIERDRRAEKIRRLEECRDKLLQIRKLATAIGESMAPSLEDLDGAIESIRSMDQYDEAWREQVREIYSLHKTREKYEEVMRIIYK